MGLSKECMHMRYLEPRIKRILFHRKQLIQKIQEYIKDNFIVELAQENDMDSDE